MLNLQLFKYDGFTMRARFNRSLTMAPFERNLAKELGSLPQCEFKGEYWTLPAANEQFDWIHSQFPHAELEDDKGLKAAWKWAAHLRAVVQRNAQLNLAWSERREAPDLSHIPFKRPPRDYQKVAFACAANAHHWALLMDMRTGKSKVLIDLLSYLASVESPKLGRPFRAAIVMPPNVMINWVRFFDQDCFVPYHLCLWNYVSKFFRDELSAKGVVGSMGGDLGATQGALDLINHKSDQLHVIFTSYGAIKGRLDLLKRLKLDCIALDESHRIKAPSSKQTQYLLDLAQHVNRRYILTGTAVTQSPNNLFTQFEFLAPKQGLLGYTTFHAFQSHHTDYKILRHVEKHNKRVVGYKNMGELLTRAAKWSFTVRREQCFSLPPKMYEKRFVEMTKEQSEIYNKVASQVLSKLESYGTEVTVQNVLVEYVKLAQIACGYFKGDDQQIHRIPGANVKVQAAWDLFEESGRVKTIIFSRFREELEDYVKLFNEHDVAFVRMDGSVRQEQRQLAIDRFQTVPHIKVFLANLGTGGEGINLNMAENCYYSSSDFSVQRRLQTEDRTQDSEQTKSVGIYDLIVEDTIDELVYERLLTRRNTAAVFSDPKELVTSLVDFMSGAKPREMDLK